MTPEIKHYEAHVTIEPVLGDRFKVFERACTAYQFKPAELLLQKQRAVTPERSNKDSFCTGHGGDYVELKQRTEHLVACLTQLKFSVWRHKIEGILLDVRADRFVHISPKA